MEKIARDHGWELNKRFGIDEEMTSLEMAADGLALTLTGTHVLEAHPRRADVVAVPWFRERVPLSLGCLASRMAEPPVAAFRQAVLGAWGRLPLGQSS
jgi:DNA-binding transcriptional LysR family regulator